MSDVTREEVESPLVRHRMAQIRAEAEAHPRERLAFLLDRFDRLLTALASAEKGRDEAMALLKVARDAMRERRGYCEEAWGWKYGTAWNEEDARLDALLARKEPDEAPPAQGGAS